MLGEGIWGRNDAAGDEILHAVGTCDPHLVRTVPVEIQGEGRRRVTQILLNRLDVVSGAEGIDCVGVPQVVDPDDIEMLQDLIMAAVNEALRKGEEAREKSMSSLAPGMGGLF